MLTAYFDESGINDSRYCTVVGFVGASQKWTVFEERWRTATRGIDFHAKRFFGRDSKGRRLDDFTDWSEAKALAHLDRILDTVLNRVDAGVLTAVGAIVDVNAFMTLPEPTRKYLTGLSLDRRRRAVTTGAPNRPYFVALPWCLAQAADCVRTEGITVDFVFDENPTQTGLTTKLYRTISEHGDPDLRRRLGTLMFKRSPGLGALQAADLLAYCCYQKATGAFDTKRELAHAVSRLDKIVDRKRKRNRLAWLDAEGLDAVVANATNSIAMIR